MKLPLIGCEHAGNTTPARAVSDLMEDTMGARVRLIRDHFKVPHICGHPSNLTDEELSQVLAPSPWIKDDTQRHN